MIEPWYARLVRWALALTLVTGVHGAMLAYALHTPPASLEESQIGGAFLVELDSVTASPDEERENVAVGRVSEERAAVAASAPQIQTEEQKPEPVPDTPPIPETTEPPPEDAVVRKEIEEKPPEEEKPAPTPAVQQMDAPAVAPVEASEAAAPPKIENAKETAPVTRGQNTGLSREDRRAIENWRRDLVVHIARHKRYPSEARRSRAHGTVEVTFEIDRTGKVISSNVSKSSGSSLLDEAAVAMLTGASPFPSPPDSIPGERHAFVVPVNFELRDR